jgi:hypothetical protein
MVKNVMVQEKQMEQLTQVAALVETLIKEQLA